MPETSTLLASLAIALLAAGLSGAVAASLKQSVIVGYIVAGVLVGPHTPGFVADGGSVEGFASIGIVLLLFVTGMEVSFRDLTRTGTVSVVGSLIQVGVMLVVGYFLGQALGWGATPSFVLGAVVSNSSSTVISKVLGERGDAGSAFGRLALAWSAVQDLTTIVLVVVITALATGGEDTVSRTAVEVAKAAVFLTVLVPVGGRVLPWLFARIRAIGHREVFLLSTAALALLTAYVASLFGLSAALGAFVAGVVLAESDIRHEVIDGLNPIRDIFVGLFFVSIGMFVDLGFVIDNAGVVVLVLALIVVVKGLLAVGLTSTFRVPIRASILSGAALAQSAEFSFLLASIGVELGALSRDQFSALVAAAVLSVIAVPGLLSGATRIGDRLEQFSNRELRLTNAVGGQLHDHVVLCGHGRVGSVVLEALLTQDVRVAVIDQDPGVVVALRDRNLLAFMGRADNEVLLRRAQLETASTLVIAVPDRATVRRLVRFARAWNPGIAIVARTHETAERDYLEANGVNDAVVGELELALQMVRYVLRSARLDPAAIEAELERVRYAVD